jgi:hypothetical protein
MKAPALTVSVLNVKQATKSLSYNGMLVQLIVYDVEGRDESGNLHSFESNDRLNVGDELEFVPRTWRDFFYEGPIITVDGKVYRMKN